MAETLQLPNYSTKDDIYAALLPQIEAVIAGVDDLIANLANVAAMLKQAFNFHWVGFYRTTAPHLLTLGPFQGPLACVSVPFSKAFAAQPRVSAKRSSCPMSTNSLAISPAAACLNRKSWCRWS